MSSREPAAFPMISGLFLIVSMAGCGRTSENPVVAAEIKPDTARADKPEPPAPSAPKAAKEAPPENAEGPREPRRILAPELEGGLGWLNTAGPLRLKDLRGKIVLLDFWTLCCINCIHTLPDLAKLEKKYANQLMVIGVHSAKFENEKDSESIRKAILRYEISHPVVNDGDMKIWQAYGANSWPTLILIDPEGYFVAGGQGEGLYEALDEAIAKLIKTHRDKKTLNEKPLRFELARFQERGDSPLFFPGKVLADSAGKRLFIADSTHHRIVITDLDGQKIAVAGTGQSGQVDGPFEKASFNDPQGMALRGDLLYVADRKNDLIRTLDLKKSTVQTLAGTGEQGRFGLPGGPALKTRLNSPWDLCLLGKRLFIAQAGCHQVWTLDLDKDRLDLYAGTGKEFIHDGPLDEACFAQPSGLTADTNGKNLYVADSEASAVRAISIGEGKVETLVGVVDLDLFRFGDKDGIGEKVRLQHALGVVYHDGKLYVADTYNSKIKVIDPEQRTCSTLVGGPAGWLSGRLFNEPGGLSYANAKLYVADTNGHRIQVVDLKTRAVSTLALKGVEAPKSLSKELTKTESRGK
jgi:DNA-binding beta-propeller fold protein YncE